MATAKPFCLPFALLLVAFALFVPWSSTTAAPNETTRVSLATLTGAQSDGPSTEAQPSGDGRYVVFQSNATNLLGPGIDANGFTDVFVRDRLLGITELISRASGVAGAQGNGSSFRSTITSDGRYVAFVSDANNLLGPGADLNGVADIFVRDRVTNTTTRASVTNAGAEANGSSAGMPAISDNGRYVAFPSAATNLTPGPVDVLGNIDVFLRDIVGGITTRITVGSGGAEPNNDSSQAAISADGSVIVFESYASNLLPPGVDTNGIQDVFIWTGGVITRVNAAGNVQPLGPLSFIQGPPSITPDGRYVSFTTDATNMIGAGNDTNGMADVFRFDRMTGTVIRASVTNAGAQVVGDHSFNGGISADGRYVAFSSAAANLIPGDLLGFGDVFVRDIVGGITEVISISTGGTLSNGGGLIGDQRGRAISSDGCVVVYHSGANNLVAGDSNMVQDVFMRERACGVAPITADIGLTKTGPVGAIAPDATITYTLTLTNNGPSTSPAIVLTDPMPVNTTFVSASQTSGPAFTLTTPAVGGTGDFRAERPSLNPGETAVFTLTVRVNSNATPGATIVNTATATNGSDPVATNNAGVWSNTVAGVTTPGPGGPIAQATATPAPTATLTPLPLIPPPVVPQIFQNPLAGVAINPRRQDTPTPVRSLAPSAGPSQPASLVIQPPRTGDAGLAQNLAR